MAFLCCKLLKEVYKDPSNALAYSAEAIINMHAEDEELVCPTCLTRMYLYGNTGFRHYPNQPHKISACFDLQNTNEGYDWQKLIIEKVINRIMRPRIIRKIKPAIDVTDNIEVISNENNYQDVIDIQEIAGLSLDTIMNMSITEIEELSQKIEDRIEEASDNGKAEEAEKTEAEDKPKIEIENPEPLQPLLTDSRDNGTTPANRTNEEIQEKEPKLLNFNNIKDLYRSGIFCENAINTIRKNPDGSSVKVWECCISRRNWKYVFSHNLFKGGMNVIELRYDGYHEGNYIHDALNQRYIQTDYIVFSAFWRDSDTKTWKTVRFFTYFVDGEGFENFRREFLYYDEKERKFKEKEKERGLIYTVGSNFEPMPANSCRECCYYGYLSQKEGKDHPFCKGCVAQFRAKIVNFDKSDRSQIYISGQYYYDS